jgi:hypothetical protein
MPSQSYVKLQDRVTRESAQGSVVLVADDLQGTWQNTDPASRGLARAVVGPGQGPTGLTLWVSGLRDLNPGGEVGPVEWGPTPIDALFAATPIGREAVAFTARYESPFAEMEFHANLSKGLLILTTMTTYREGQGLRNAFAREFFSRVQSGGG